MPTITHKQYLEIAEKVGVEKMRTIEDASGVSTGLLEPPKSQTCKPHRKKADEKPDVAITCTKEEFLEALREQPHTIADYNRIKFGEPTYVLCNPKEVEDQTEQIIYLHEQVTDHLQKSFTIALKIGEMLLSLKENHIQRGNFGKWMKQNLPFTTRTGQRYMQLYLYREDLAKREVQTITEAYREIQGEAQDSEVLEVEDNTTIHTTWDMVAAQQEVDNVRLPVKKVKGIEEKVQINPELIERMETSNYPFAGKYTKFVVTIPANEAHKALLPKFIIAASRLLMSGGKLVFVKR